MENNIQTISLNELSAADRRVPPCQHFGSCGGCSLQHYSEKAYNKLKNGQLLNVISAMGADPKIVRPLIEIGQFSRRRCDFKVAVNKGDVSVGFYKAKTHEVIKLSMCKIITHELFELRGKIETCLVNLKKPGLIKSINITMVDEGFDISISISKSLSARDLLLLIEFAKANNVWRLSQMLVTPNSRNAPEFELVFVSKPVTVTFNKVAVALPIGAFLQATHQGEIAIIGLIKKYLKGSQRVADIYSGCGTYSFGLKDDIASCTAYEGSAEMVLAMHNAIKQNQLQQRIGANVRDLFYKPLLADELNKFDAVVINPPRNGALPQIKQLALSNVKNIVMVSCNINTFKRDAEYLLKHGFQIKEATVIDQFYWSKHLEIVAFFTAI